VREERHVARHDAPATRDAVVQPRAASRRFLQPFPQPGGGPEADG